MRKIRFGILLFAVMTALLTAGCGLNEKSAEKYVKDLMDYLSGKQTSSDIFDAEIRVGLRVGVLEGLEEVTDPYLEEGEELSPELKTRLADATVEALKKIKYTVGSAKKTEDGFEVPVTIEPLLLYDKVVENLNREFAGYISGFTDPDDFKVSEYLELVMESMVDTTEEASQNPKYGEPVEFVFPLIVVDNQLEVKDEKITAESLGEQLTNAKLEYWAREKDPQNFKKRVEAVLDGAISGKYDESAAVYDNAVAYGCHFTYENNMLYTPEEAKQDFMADGDSAELAEKEAAFLCSVQKMSTYKCMDMTEKDGDYAVAVSVTAADIFTFLNNLSDEISASITDEEILSFSSAEEFSEYYDKLLYDEANKRINEMVYKEPEEHLIRFSMDPDLQAYVLNSDDVTDILVALTLNS